MATPSPTPPALTGDPRIDGLMEPSAWEYVPGTTLRLTWSPHDFGGTWTDAELQYVQQAFNAWSHVTNVRFVRIGDVANFRFAHADIAVVATGMKLQQLEDAIGLGFTPDPGYNTFDLFGTHYTSATYPHSQGDIFFDDPQSLGYTPGSTDFMTLLHEIGHALGLKHPHDEPRSFSDLGISAQNNNDWTVMSYRHPHGNAQPLYKGWPVTPMPLDVLAIQHIYGPNMGFHTGDNTYWLLDDGTLRTIWDAGGTDTLNASRYAGGGLNLSLQPGVFNFVSPDSMVVIAYNVTIERAVGTAFGDRISGNSSGNLLSGGAGNDVLLGRDGDDVLQGGGGNDQLTGGGGADELHGGGSNDVLIGGVGPDALHGGGGADVLRGGDGNDVLEGGPGNDAFEFNTVPGPGNVDTIADFEGAGAQAQDVIHLAHGVFGSLAAGALDGASFVSGVNPAAADANDFILYDTATGALYYDADGNGPGAAVEFAVLATHPDALDASDFTIV